MVLNAGLADDTITWTKGEVLGKGAYGIVSILILDLKKDRLDWLDGWRSIDPQNTCCLQPLQCFRKPTFMFCLFMQPCAGLLHEYSLYEGHGSQS